MLAVMQNTFSPSQSPYQPDPASTQTLYSWDFLGGPVVNPLSFNAEGVSSIPGWGARIPYASWPKNQNLNSGSNIVVNSKRLLKMAHSKTIFKKIYIPIKILLVQKSHVLLPKIFD